MHSLKQHLQQMTNKIVLVPANNHISYISQSLFIHIHLLVQQLTKHNFAIQLKLNEATGLKKVTHTNTRLTAPFPRLPRWAITRKVKPIWILLKQETVSGSGISWATRKPAPRSRQTTTPAPHHSVFYRPDALPAAQPTASKHWRPSGRYIANNEWVCVCMKCRRSFDYNTTAVTRDVFTHAVPHTSMHSYNPMLDNDFLWAGYRQKCLFPWRKILTATRVVFWGPYVSTAWLLTLIFASVCHDRNSQWIENHIKVND